ncbi:hypothetical protein TNIN_438861 [Trichonephila inaurata madagascariensis]|uniref:Uncharacterized protein n=1 Tax=Trichonephila inaurata madagascariensis TaxID=2747483 RepID=A0A8X7CI67_9ARAC|nr:hypothetical protein TNIN_438861 [Trichonephila inaurata madagascariensis]
MNLFSSHVILLMGVRGKWKSKSLPSFPLSEDVPHQSTFRRTSRFRISIGLAPPELLPHHVGSFNVEHIRQVKSVIYSCLTLLLRYFRSPCFYLTHKGPLIRTNKICNFKPRTDDEVSISKANYLLDNSFIH